MRRNLYLLTLWLSFSATAIEPDWTYKVLVSPHFEIVFRDQQKELAKRYLIAAEQAHELLMPIFKEGPLITIVVLQDDTDLANGLANFLPYPHIVVYPVLPQPGDTIDEYGDWPLEMMIHEYTHILNMYPAHGIYAPFKYIFGTVVRPNAVLPRWYLEGLAVNLETRLSDFGRLRSVETAASARALVLSDKLKLEDIATINEDDIGSYPYGGRAYLYGGWWWDEVQRRKGADVIYNLNQNYSRRLPFFVSGPIEEQTGLAPEPMLRAALKTQSEKASEQISTIRAKSGHETEDFLPGTEAAMTFRLSPDRNRFVYWQGKLKKGAFAYVRTRESLNQNFKDAPEKKLFRSVGTTRVEWLSNDEIVFDQIDAARPRVQYRDLFKYNFVSGETERLTDGARAQDAAVAPGGQKIAFIQSDSGKTKLSLLSLTDKKITALVAGPMRARLSSPEFLDENHLLFVVRNRDGAERIYIYDFQNRKSRVYFSKMSAVQDLRRTALGLVFTDSATGVRNAYRLEKSGAIPVTNSLTAIHGIEFDPGTKNLILSELTADGPRLKQKAFAPVEPPRVSKTEIEKPLAPTTEKVTFREENFWPVSYLAPRYLIPTIFSVEEGYIVQGVTSGQDPIGRNVYTLGGSYDSVTEKPSYGLSYLNSSFRTTIGVGYNHSVTYLGASGRIIESTDAALNFGGPLTSRWTAWNLGGLWSETEGRFNRYRRLGPSVGLAYRGLESPYRDGFGVTAEVSHSEYMGSDGYLGYGRSFAHLALVKEFGEHKVGLQVRGALAPKLPMNGVIDLGDRTVGGNYLVSLTNSEFLMRGYPSGTFVGRKLLNGNLEWVFPASELTRGFGLFPLFLRRVEVALFGDAVTVDGGAQSQLLNGYARSYLDEFYIGTGAEARFMTTMAYHVPVSVTLGLYYGFKDEYGGGLAPFIGFGLGSLGPISKKTP